MNGKRVETCCLGKRGEVMSSRGYYLLPQTRIFSLSTHLKLGFTF
jgi:hypothetical protein